MGKKQRDCAGCGAPVGFIGREHCCLCERKIREAAAKAECPGCGKQRILQDETGRCALCSRCCRECGHPVRRTCDTLCRDCRRKARQATAQRPCPRCGRPGYLREATGWCGPCSRPRQQKDPPRECAQCGQVRRHAGLGMCSACFQRRPDRAFTAGAGLAARLASPPDWLDGFIAHLAGAYSPGPGLPADHRPWPAARRGRAARSPAGTDRTRPLARPVDGPAGPRPGDLLHRRTASPCPPTTPSSWPPDGGSAASTPFPGRCGRPWTGSPARCSPPAQRARRAGTRPRSDHTIETALATVRDLALFLADGRGKQDWALADVHDVEAFLATLPRGAEAAADRAAAVLPLRPQPARSSSPTPPGT